MRRVTTPDHLRAAREELGLTQEALANALGMTQNSVAKMEGGARPITERTEKQVLALLEPH